MTGCNVKGNISSLIYVLFLVTKSVTEITQFDCVDTITGNVSKGSAFMFLSLFSTIMYVCMYVCMYYYYYYYYHYHHRISHFSALAGKYSPILGCSNQQD